MMFVRCAALAAILTLAVSSFAALSPTYQEWGSGPVQWIMTAAEQRQWKQLATDGEAQHFIDLFWARRDPTPGTPQNEFLTDFQNRVERADRYFPDKDSTGTVIGRGAMSDRGRVLLVLGVPPNVRREDDTPETKDVWVWEKDEANAKFGLPRVEVDFVRDSKGVFRLVTANSDFANAVPAAMKAMLVSPDLKNVPEWAKQTPSGAHALVLMTDVSAASPDALLNGRNVVTFAKSGRIGFAFEYCGPAETLNMTTSILGTAGEKPLQILMPPVAVKAHASTSKSSCGMVRAAIPLAGLPLERATYTFVVKLDDGAQSYNLTQDFRIE